MTRAAEIAPGCRERINAVRIRVARTAADQAGVLSRAELHRCGVGDSTITRWLADGFLHRVHPGVHAVGHGAIDLRGRLVAALRYAGPAAALSHWTAAWWWGLIDSEPERIHISGSRRRRPSAGVRLHRPRRLERCEHRGLPVTTVERTLLDLATVASYRDLRRAVAEADHLRLLDPEAIAARVGPGQPGSAALRRALREHLPDLAATLSALEERFLALCQLEAIPAPEVNVTVAGHMVDALWADQRVIVELDGHAAHGSPAAIARDRRRDLELRAAGYTVLRYTWDQLVREPDRVAADLIAVLGASRRSG